MKTDSAIQPRLNAREFLEQASESGSSGLSFQRRMLAVLGLMAATALAGVLYLTFSKDDPSVKPMSRNPGASEEEIILKSGSPVIDGVRQIVARTSSALSGKELGKVERRLRYEGDDLYVEDWRGKKMCTKKHYKKLGNQPDVGLEDLDLGFDADFMFQVAGYSLIKWEGLDAKSEEGVFTVDCDYDEEGRLVKEAYRSGSGEDAFLEISVFEYDTKGRLVKYSGYSDEDLQVCVGEHAMKYDEYNCVVLQTDAWLYNPATPEEVVTETSWTRDAQKRPLKSVTVNANWTMTSRWDYYGEGGLKSYVVATEAGESVTTFEKQFDEYGVLTGDAMRREETQGKRTVGRTATYRFDAKGRLVEIKRAIHDDSEKTAEQEEVVEFIYD